MVKNKSNLLSAMIAVRGLTMYRPHVRADLVAFIVEKSTLLAWVIGSKSPWRRYMCVDDQKEIFGSTVVRPNKVAASFGYRLYSMKIFSALKRIAAGCFTYSYMLDSHYEDRLRTVETLG